MYCYVYDEALQDRRYERELAQIETRLTDLGIAGKIARLALFRDPIELIRDEIRAGVTTIVAVGNDLTLRRVIDAVGDRKTVVALLPIGPQGGMTALLGMPSGVAACDVLSARIVEELDVGEVNGKRFVQSVHIEGTDFVVHFGKQYTLTPQRKATLEMRNFAEPDDAGIQSPVDGRLSCIIRLPKFSLFKGKANVGVVPFEEVFVACEKNVTALVDGDRLEGKDFVFRVIPRALRLVTGKTRKF
ncbi:MAG: diacylglycerol kinase family protein [Patescibacteria group bacterium]